MAQTMTGPEHTEARPRADRSSVAGCNDADFEQTAAQSPGKMLQISCRQQTSLREGEREREKLHQTEAKPADSEVQARSAKTAAFSRKAVHSNKQRGNLIQQTVRTATQNSKAWELQPACNAREKRQE